MKKGSFILGLGIGIFAMSILFMMLGNGLRNSHEQAQAAIAMESDNRAVEIAELETQKSELMESLHMMLQPESIILEATAMGMTFADEAYDAYGEDYYADEYYADEYYEEVVEQQQPQYTPPAVPDPQASVAQALQEDVQTGPDPGYIPTYTPSAPTVGSAVHVSIPSGSALQVISSILQDQGIVDDASAFTAFVVESGAATRIMAGDFTLNQGSDYGEVMRRLTGGN